MKKKIIQRSVLGFFVGIAIGQLISVLISVISGDGSFIACSPEFAQLIGNEADAAALQTLLCGVMGIGFSAASVIWEIDDLIIAAQSGICFTIYAAVLLPIAYFTNWMEHSLVGIVSYIIIFAVSFAVVWLVQFLVWRKCIRSINDKLSE